MSFLSAIAKVPLAVFHWLASDKGQATIAAGEALAVSIDPALAGLITVANSWLQKIITTETIAAAAGQQSGTGVQKAAAVLAAMQPQIDKYFPAMTAEKIQEANSHLVAFLNVLDGTQVAATNAFVPAPAKA